MSSTLELEPAWRGKHWQELNADDWRILRETNNPLWYAMVIESEQYPQNAKAAPLAAPTPVPTADPSPEYVRPEEVYPRFLRPFLSGIAKVLKEVKDKTDKTAARILTLEDRTASMAAASKVAEYDARISALSAKVDKLTQALSASQKHVQSLERKLGGIVNP